MVDTSLFTVLLGELPVSINIWEAIYMMGKKNICSCKQVFSDILCCKSRAKVGLSKGIRNTWKINLKMETLGEWNIRYSSVCLRCFCSLLGKSAVVLYNEYSKLSVQPVSYDLQHPWLPVLNPWTSSYSSYCHPVAYGSTWGYYQLYDLAQIMERHKL